MKKVLALILSVVTVACLMGISANAASYEEKIVSERTEYFSDGSSVVITVTEKITPATRAAAYSKSGSKTYTSKNSSGEILWKFTLKGTFSVNSGVSATCTSTSYSKSNLADGWSLKSGSSYASGNQAIGDGTFQHKTLFVVTDTKSCHVVLKCDANGNLS